MSVPAVAPAPGGVPLERAHAALRELDPSARAFWIYDLDAFAARAARFRAALASLAPRVAYAVKANGLPALLAAARAAGLDAECGSIGELTLAEASGFGAAARSLGGNARTPEEARWAAERGVAFVSADHVGELDLLEREAVAAGTNVRVALRVNPGIATPGHRYVATGHDDAKFGIGPDDALEAWAARARWSHLRLDGVHVHVGSQLLEAGPLERAATFALELADAAAARGAPLALVDMGGGFGIDYTGAAGEFPLEAFGRWLASRAGGRTIEWAFEPGRWLAGPVGVLVSEVLWVKRREGGEAARRFVVLAAGMNDLLRPALYGAHHAIVPVRPRAGAPSPACVVGPVCESADVFAADALLPPIEGGDLVAILDAGAYGAAMGSNYNGRGRLAELVASGGRLRLARAAESPAALAARACDDALDG